MGFDVAWRDNYDDGFDFVIKTSLDGVNFTEVYRGQANSKIEQASYYEFAENVEARYVEFIVDVRYSSLAYYVSEFGVYGQKD